MEVTQLCRKSPVSASSSHSAQAAVINEAIGILESRMRTSKAFTKPDEVKQFCQLQIACEQDEHFCCLFLDNQHRLIAFERLFRSTIGCAYVYPRVVVRRALELNAAALVFTHNHPSGSPEPSTTDTRITQRLKDAPSLVEIRTLDHIIIGTSGATSMAESGLI